MCRKTLPFSLASNRFVLKITRFESRLFVLTPISSVFRVLRLIFSSRNGSSPTPRTKRRSLFYGCRKNLPFRICELGLYSRDIGVTSRYFGQDSQYIVAARQLMRNTRETLSRSLFVRKSGRTLPGTYPIPAGA